MIVYITKENNLIKITNSPRTEEEKEYTELLYTIDNYNEDLKNIYNSLRPFICLWKNNEQYYKFCPEVLSYFEEKNYLTNSSQDIEFIYIYEEDIVNFINTYINIIKFLNTLGFSFNIEEENSLLITERQNIKYDCDVINYLEDRFGKDLIELANRYKNLSAEKKNFLHNFSKFNTRDKKLEFINQELQKFGDYTNLLEFIPKWYRLSLKLFGTYDENTNIEEESLEFKNQTELGYKEDNTDIESIIKNKMFSSFDLGKVYSGNIIKEKVQDIYDHCGLKKTAKINDIFKYFRVVKVNLNQESSYRISTRRGI